MKMVKFRFTGLTPLLTHNSAGMKRSDGLNTKKIPTPEEEAEAGAFRNANGELCIPAVHFRNCIIGKGGSGTGRRLSGKFTANSRVQAGYFLMQDMCVICDPDTGRPVKNYEIDTQSAVVQKARILRSRPKFNKWMVELTAEIDEDMVTVQQVLELLKIAGKICGVGDFRVACKGIYGRFDVELLTK